MSAGRSYGARGSGDPKRAQELADAWNEKHPPGTRVAYWTILPPTAPALVTTTWGSAFEMCGTAVVFLKGKAGCVNIAHLAPLEDATVAHDDGDPEDTLP